MQSHVAFHTKCRTLLCPSLVSPMSLLSPRQQDSLNPYLHSASTRYTAYKILQLWNSNIKEMASWWGKLPRRKTIVSATKKISMEFPFSWKPSIFKCYCMSASCMSQNSVDSDCLITLNLPNIKMSIQGPDSMWKMLWIIWYY